MTSALDSIYSVWSWGCKSGGDIYRQVVHASCSPVQQTSVGTSPDLVSSPVSLIPPEMPLTSPFVRLAGVSGVLAVALGAYGAHVLGVDPEKAKLRATFDTANKYHLIHSAALLAVPLARLPRLSGSLLLSGMVIFSGTTYYHALTGDTNIRKYTPYGGMLLIVAWLSFVL